MCRLAAAASEQQRRGLSELTTTTTGTVSGANLVGQDIFDLLTMYFVVTVEVDPDKGAYVQVRTHVHHVVDCVWESQGDEEG